MNKEDLRKYRGEYYQKHKERIDQRAKERKQEMALAYQNLSEVEKQEIDTKKKAKTKERVKYNKLWVNNNKEKYYAYQKEWRNKQTLEKKEQLLEKQRISSRKNYAENRDQIRAKISDKYYERIKTDPEFQRKLREKHLNEKYGIGIEEFEKMFAEHNGVCAICHLPETKFRNGKVRRLSIDHDHLSGAIRGLLCHNCNTLIGHAKDDPDVLRSAADYLEQHANNPLAD